MEQLEFNSDSNDIGIGYLQDIPYRKHVQRVQFLQQFQTQSRTLASHNLLYLLHYPISIELRLALR